MTGLQIAGTFVAAMCGGFAMYELTKERPSPWWVTVLFTSAFLAIVAGFGL